MARQTQPWSSDGPPRAHGMIHFYDPDLLQRNGASTFLCEGNETSNQSVFGCEPIRKTVFDLGVATSHELIRSNEQPQLRTTIPPKPPPSGYASIDDINKVPLKLEQGLDQYRRFLRWGLPRAFAVSPDRRHWGWHFGTYDSMERALTLCAHYAQQACQLYAVDEDVVWYPR